MTPIVRHPKVVREYSTYFGDMFSKPQQKHFQKLLTGIIVCNNQMITGINGSFVEGNDQSSLNRFLTQSNWSEEKLNEKRLTLLQEKDMGWKKSGCISIDDVLIEKTGKKIVEIGKLFDIARGDMLLLSSL